MFSAALASTGPIDLNRNNLQTDSFDSADPNYSAGGFYPFGSVTNTLSNGDMLTADSLTNSTGTGSASVKGQLRIGPNGTIDIGASGSVGDRAWVEGGNPGIEPGRSANDVHVFFPTPTLPSGWAPIVPLRGAYLMDGVMYDYSLTNGQWRFSNLGSGNFKIHIAGNAQVVVTSSLSMSGNDVIQIGTNASLKLYLLGGSASFGGLGVANPNGTAGSFSFYGLAGNTNVILSATNSLAGTMLAPSANLTIGSGGIGMLGFVGGIVAKSVKLNGDSYFYFDEDLKRTGPFR
jgi:hypothetical protein